MVDFKKINLLNKITKDSTLAITLTFEQKKEKVLKLNQENKLPDLFNSENEKEEFLIWAGMEKNK